MKRFLEGTRDQADGLKDRTFLIKIIFSIINLINIGYYEVFCDN